MRHMCAMLMPCQNENCVLCCLVVYMMSKVFYPAANYVVITSAAFSMMMLIFIHFIELIFSCGGDIDTLALCNCSCIIPNHFWVIIWRGGGGMTSKGNIYETCWILQTFVQKYKMKYLYQKITILQFWQMCLNSKKTCDISFYLVSFKHLSLLLKKNIVCSWELYKSVVWPHMKFFFQSTFVHCTIFVRKRRKIANGESKQAFYHRHYSFHFQNWKKWKRGKNPCLCLKVR